MLRRRSYNRLQSLLLAFPPKKSDDTSSDPSQDSSQQNDQQSPPWQSQQQQPQSQQTTQQQDQQLVNPQDAMQQQPAGDPIDTIAQMLCLDLSSAANPIQQGQMVVAAVEQLVMQLHQLTGEPQQDDMGGDPSQQDDGGAFDDIGDPNADPSQEQDDPSQDDPSQDDPQQQDDKPQFPPKRKAAVAASHEMERALEMSQSARVSEIRSLVQEGYLSPVVGKRWIDKYASIDALSLALSQDADEDDYEWQRESVIANGRVLSFGEQSGPQTELSVLEANGNAIQLSADEIVTTKNPLIASAAARSNRFEAHRTNGEARRNK